MIFEVYVLMFAISLILLFIGYYSDTSITKIMAFSIIFILGVILIGYTDSLTIPMNTTVHEINSTYSVIAPSYENYENQQIGFILSTMALLGFVSVFLDYRGFKK